MVNSKMVNSKVKLVMSFLRGCNKGIEENVQVLEQIEVG